jgi:hypothetical protein
MPPLTDDAVKLAVEITIASVPLSSGTWIANPDAVAKFVEVVAKKINELKLSPDASKY